MNEDRLRERLAEVRVPDADRAERRGRALVVAAFAERQPQTRRTALPRLAVAFAAITLLTALLLSPAGAAVRDWIGDAFTVGVRDAEPALTEVPGGGQLLVQSPEGPWVVQPDGSRRLLGDYAEAAWSPRGLFVATAAGRTLNAIEPDGTPRWSLSAGSPVADPRWSPSGLRIAYRAGRSLRIVVGDGSGSHLLARGVAPLPPAWFPLGPHLLAYVDAERTVRVLDADTGRRLAALEGPAGIEELAWSPDGDRLLLATRTSLWIREVTVGKLGSGLRFGPPQRGIALPPGTTIRAATLSPADGQIAALLELPAAGGRPARSSVVLSTAGKAPPRPLFTAPGRLSDLTWSPDGNRLLIGWPDADQWLFVPVAGTGRPHAFSGISAEFSPGESGTQARFPEIEGWCCAATAGNPESP